MCIQKILIEFVQVRDKHGGRSRSAAIALRYAANGKRAARDSEQPYSGHSTLVRPIASISMAKSAVCTFWTSRSGEC